MAKNNELKFNFGAEGTATSGRNQIRHTAQLKSISDMRATEALRASTQDNELFELAKAALDSGDAGQLFNFLETAVGDNIETDAKFLADATEKEFDSMLESRRSDRSHTKAKGLYNSATIAHRYIATGYAEMLVRHAWGKPYDAPQTSTEIDPEDLDAINRKIKSLQSKKSRLNLPVQLGDAAAKQQQDEVIAEIERLQQFRPATRSTSKTVIKDMDTDTIRAALQAVDKAALDEEQLAKLEALMAKLG